MKPETWIFGSVFIFMAIVAPAYWFVTNASEHGGDWTGTSALVMCALLALMCTVYLGFHARRMEPRPEDRKDGEIADGAGEMGFFPPFSWWPLWTGLAAAVSVFAVAMAAWWLLIIGGAVGFIALAGWNFEYYRGEFKH